MTDAITTTLKAIRKHRPCGLKRGSDTGYDWLRKNLGKGYGDTTPIKFSQIVESNGIDDALWCLRALPEEYHPKIRLLAAEYAERVLHLYEKEYPDDDRPRKAIESARLHAEGKISDEKLDAAGAAAWAAAGDAAWDAARAAAWAAAWAAAGDAAWDAAWAAARDAERKIQAELLVKYFG